MVGTEADPTRYWILDAGFSILDENRLAEQNIGLRSIARRAQRKELIELIGFT